MLQSIQIKDFAIIDELTVSFQQGMTVLTGETGAGKSIIIDALALLIGGRGSSEFVRFGKDKAVLQGLFDVSTMSHVESVLIDKGIECEDNQLIITRELHKTGKSIVRVNGVLTTLAVLKEIGQLLVDIHGQHEHQHLMDEKQHLNLLDRFAFDDIKASLEEYQSQYMLYTQQKKELKRLMETEKNDTQRVSLLKRHIADIEEISPKEQEDALLEEERQMLLKNQAEFQGLSKLDTVLLHDEHGADRLMKEAAYITQHLQEVDGEKYGSVASQLQDVIAVLSDITKDMGILFDGISFDESRLQYIEERLNQLDTLKERYGETLQDVLSYYAECTQELDKILNKDKYVLQAQQSFLASHQSLIKSAESLSQLRQKHAQRLEDMVHAELHDLYMGQVRFKVLFNSGEKTDKLRSTGKDAIEFLVATNTGEPLKPLVKVASGGEVSRMMLALKTIFTKSQLISTVVFDEIDTGVSGRVAQSIADKMSHISQTVQVLAITHLPQVAAKANQHLFVEKKVVDEKTATHVRMLTEAERIHSVAHMFAGENITAAALEHAKELLESK